MKIYFAGGGGKDRHAMLNSKKAAKLYSYYDIITPDQGYGQEDRFAEDIERNKLVLDSILTSKTGVGLGVKH
jgi:hypothetical protein